MKTNFKNCKKCGSKFRTKFQEKELCMLCRKPNKWGYTRTVYTSNCIYCSEEFQHSKKKRKFCGEKCRNNHYHRVKRKSTVENTLTQTFYSVKSRAKRKNLELDITKEWILELLKLQNSCCAITGIPLKPSKRSGFKGKDPYTVSIDRIDSNRGYTKDNTQLVCSIVNEFKNCYDISVVDFVCKQYIKFNKVKIE